MEDVLKLKKEKEVVEGEIIKKENKVVLLDLGILGIGRIYGSEYLKHKEILDKKKVGDKIFAKILDIDDEDGYVDLTLLEPKEELRWEQLRNIFSENEIIKMKVEKVNRGGALGKIGEFLAFLPQSQMSEETLKDFEQNILVGKEIEVKILDVDSKKNTLILSQKEEFFESEIQVGKKIEGEVSSLSEFGVFVKIKPDLEAMIPILELPQKTLKIGQKVVGKIYKISNGRIYLTLK